MPQLFDVMLVVAQRHRIQAAFRRLATAKRVEAILREHLIDGANPVGPLGMPGRGQVVEACRMGQKKCHTIAFRAVAASLANTLGTEWPLGKGRAAQAFFRAKKAWKAATASPERMRSPNRWLS